MNRNPGFLKCFLISHSSLVFIFGMSAALQSDDLVAVEEQSLEMQSCATKLSTIREVLLRRHMKVAFFGR